MFSYGLLHMDTPVLNDHQKFTFISSVLTLDVILKTHQEQWTTGTDGKIESRKSMLTARLAAAAAADDDDGG